MEHSVLILSQKIFMGALSLIHLIRDNLEHCPEQEGSTIDILILSESGIDFFIS